MAKHCVKCGAKLGFLGGYSDINGRNLCWNCYSKLPILEQKQCYCETCAYYKFVNDYEGECKRDFNRSVGYKKRACEHYQKG